MASPYPNWEKEAEEVREVVKDLAVAAMQLILMASLSKLASSIPRLIASR